MKEKKYRYNLRYDIFQDEDKVGYEIEQSYTDYNGDIIMILSDDNHIKYYKNYVLHREGGPAVLLYEGDKSWWKNGKMHREDGPAEELRDGRRIWWYEDKRIDCKNQEEFERIMKLRLFW
jgi:hypothetical protein